MRALALAAGPQSEPKEVQDRFGAATPREAHRGPHGLAAALLGRGLGRRVLPTR